MFSRAFHAVAYPVERAFYSIEMFIAAVRRGLVRDVGTILSSFERIAADLDAYIKREQAANAADHASLDAIYERIDARREAVGRAVNAANNIRRLTSSN